MPLLESPDESQHNEGDVTAIPATTEGPETEVDYPRVGLMSSAHLVNDLYGNLMTSLTPYLVIRGDISTAAAGLVLLVYLVGSSVLQPIFGLLSDRTGHRFFAIFGPLWIGIAAAAFPWGSSSAALLAIAFVGGIGTAAFHPQGATMVHRISSRQRGWSMSIFSMGGNVGFAIGPLIAAFLASTNLHWSPVVVLPGLILTLLLLRYAPPPQGEGLEFRADLLRETVRRAWLPLSVVVAVIALRSASQYSMIIFLPLYEHARGLPPQLGSYAAFMLSLAGALGGLAGGTLSDRYGRRIVVVLSLAIAAPLLFLIPIAPGALLWPVVVGAGIALISSNSVTVVLGQELLPGSTGVASGLTMGFGFGLSGLFTSILTSVSGHIGVERAIFLVPLLTLIAAVLAVFIRYPKHIGR